MPEDSHSLKRTQELFERALEREGEEREQFLSDACGGDIELRARIEQLLAAHDTEDSFLDLHPVDRVLNEMPELSTLSVEQSLVGAQIGNYRILRVIASGGMGTVYEAMQEQPQRRIALKVLKSELASPEAIRHSAECSSELPMA